MLDFGYPPEIRQDIKVFAGDDTESRTQAIEETRFRAALQFWSKFFHRVIIDGDRAFYVIPPSQEVFDNNPVVRKLPVREALSSIMHLQRQHDENQAAMRKLKTWHLVLLAILGLMIWILVKAISK